MTEKIIEIAKDFSQYPGGRFSRDGPNSGESFRDRYLEPALRTHDRVIIILDGTAGYPSSFLEEAFGGLVRQGWDSHDLYSKLDVRARDPRYEIYRVLALRYISEASGHARMAT